MREKAAVHAPIASESDTSAAAVTILFRRHSRAANATSRTIDSMRGSSLMSRLASRISAGLPNCRRARALASSTDRPAAVYSSVRASR